MLTVHIPDQPHDRHLGRFSLGDNGRSPGRDMYLLSMIVEGRQDARHLRRLPAPGRPPAAAMNDGAGAVAAKSYGDTFLLVPLIGRRPLRRSVPGSATALSLPRPTLTPPVTPAARPARWPVLTARTFVRSSLRSRHSPPCCPRLCDSANQAERLCGASFEAARLTHLTHHSCNAGDGNRPGRTGSGLPWALGSLS
jgi:hypothetical protein